MDVLPTGAEKLLRPEAAVDHRGRDVAQRLLGDGEVAALLGVGQDALAPDLTRLPAYLRDAVDDLPLLSQAKGMSQDFQLAIDACDQIVFPPRFFMTRRFAMKAATCSSSIRSRRMSPKNALSAMSPFL